MRRSRAAAQVLRPALLLLLLATAVPQARAESAAQWVELGTRVHGGYGAFIPLGIRIGLDALERLKAKPRDVSVTYLDSRAAPCACIADGVMLAVVASPGQRTLTIAPETAADGLLASITIRHKTTGAAVRYDVPFSALARLGEWNKTLEPSARHDAVMGAGGLFLASDAKP